MKPLLKLIVLAFGLAAAPDASAQSRPAPVIDLAAGWAGFADDGIVSETPFSAAARLYVTRRLSIGPEVVLIEGNAHRHQVVTGNLTFDFIESKPGALTPYVVAGGGMFRTSESGLRPPFSSTEGAFTLGGGLRYRPTQRISVGIDARTGWEPHVRVTGGVSIHLGRN